MKVIESLREVGPERVYVACDGPKANSTTEAAKVLETRRIISTSIDWTREVFLKYSDVNLGCREGVSQAISWFFETEEEGVILKDDVVPEPEFFPFCERGLNLFRHDLRVGSITADARSHNNKYHFLAPHFSHYFLCWGWATWRSRWLYYKVTLEQADKFIYSGWLEAYYGRRCARYFSKIFYSIQSNEYDTWAYIFLLTHWQNSWAQLCPPVNLASNIGFGVDASHTRGVNPLLVADREFRGNTDIDLRVPHCYVIPHVRADRLFIQSTTPASISSKVSRKLKAMRNLFVGRR